MCCKICLLLKDFSLYKCGANLFAKARTKTKERFPTVYCLFFDQVNKWRILRYTLGYLYGLFIAIIFWDVFIVDLGLPFNVTYNILFLFMAIIGLGYALSKKMRCVVLLTCIGFLGKSGRSLLRAMTFALIVAGPLANLALNGKEVIRVFACSTILTYNLTKNRFDLMTKPFRNAILGIRENMSEIKETFNEVKEVVEPVLTEIEKSDPPDNTTGIENSNGTRSKRNSDFDPSDGSAESAEHYREEYLDKMRKRCQLQLKKGENKCKDAFNTAYEKCYQKLPVVVNTLLCWPMKITVVCNIELLGFGKGKNGICDPSKIIDRDLGENFADLKETEGKFVNGLNSARVDYTVPNPKHIPGVSTAKDTGKAVVREFTKGKSLFDKFMYVIRRILAFIFVKVIIASSRYHKKYMKNIEFDNHYITDYFKKIDNRRKERGQHTLLPLKKIERAAIIDPLESRKIKSESRALSAHFLKLLLEIITALIFLMLDHIISVLLEIIAKNARIEYHQEGTHTVQVMVNGTGIIAGLLRATLRGFNMSESVSTVMTNDSCLPKPNRLSTWFYVKIVLLYSTVIFLVCNESFMIRIRRVVCSYFYPKREKRRVLHLYNKLLKRRRTIFKTMYRTVKERMLANEYKIHLNILTLIRVRCPIFFGWLRNFEFARRKCIICEEPEPKRYDKNRPYNFAKCKTWGCYAVHCEECWIEIGQICLACHKIEEIDESARTNNQKSFESDLSDF